MDYTYEQAQQRVANHPELAQYYDILCEYDWPEGQRHINWVCTAPLSEIIDWCETVAEG